MASHCMAAELKPTPSTSSTLYLCLLVDHGPIVLPTPQVVESPDNQLLFQMQKQKWSGP